MTSLKVLKFGPEDAFHSLATKMLKEALKKDPGRWWYIGSTLFSEDYPLENIARLGYQQFGCTKCGSKELPETCGKCQQCYEPFVSSPTSKKLEDPPTLKPLKYASWRAPQLPDHSDLVDIKTATYYSRCLLYPGGFTRLGLKIGESQRLRGYSGFRGHIELLPGFFVRNMATGITKSYAKKSTRSVAQVMEQGAKKNLDALFQIRIKAENTRKAVEEINHQLRFVDRLISKGHLKGQVRAIYRNLERYEGGAQ